MEPEWGASTFIKLRADHLRLTNPGTIGVDLRTPACRSWRSCATPS